MKSLISVIMCGGSGTRLWPLSRKALPKQFVPLLHGKSLLQLTLERAATLSHEQLIVAAHDHRFLVQECINAAKLHAQTKTTILLEPTPRNTAAAMAVAALNAAADALLLFLPADHHIPDNQAFARMVEAGIPLAQAGHIVTFGVTPSFPSTAYGYIQQGENNRVLRFVEKPHAERAQAMLLEGGYLWNAGIFLCKASTLLEAQRQHCPDILEACNEAVETQAMGSLDSVDSNFCHLGEFGFSRCRSESIDYAVMEKADNVVVLPFSSAWSDVGSWNAVGDLTPADDQGNRVEGNGYVFNSSKTFVYAQSKAVRPVIALGMENTIIIDTVDAVLVANANACEQVKNVVAALEAQGVQQALHHRHVARPWGSYDLVDSGERFQVKRIVVKPGASLSLQKHHHRAEHWVVVSGTAEVTNGDKVILLSENQSTYIPLGQVHRLSNPGKIPMEIIEGQSGAYLGEDDNVRLEDTYGRITR